MGTMNRWLDLFRSAQGAFTATRPAGAQHGSWTEPRGSMAAPSAQARAPQLSGTVEDQAALDRYRYLLRTAPPEQLEQVHAEAFARLTPDQRRRVLDDLAEEVPAGEHTATADDPQALARMATRAEVRRPGTLERVLGGAGVGTGGALVGGLLAGVATAVVGSALIDAVVDTGFGDSGLFDLGGDAPLGLGGFDEPFDL